MNARYEAVIARMPVRSAWQRGVREYAREFLEALEENNIAEPSMAAMLNGAKDANQWAWSGCGLIYDTDIAERLCSPSELRRVRGGERRPNAREEWLDVEARAAFQAMRAILRLAKAVRP